MSTIAEIRKYVKSLMKTEPMAESLKFTLKSVMEILDADKTISSPGLSGVYHFGGLPPTPSRDSR